MVLFLAWACSPDQSAESVGLGADPAADTAGRPAELAAPAPVVVVGAGLAGLAAAAHLPGAVVLEAREEPGGRALLAGGMMWLVGTPEQAEAGVEDSVEAALADWPTLTGGPPTAATEAWMRDTAAVRDRLEAAGVDITLRVGEDPVVRSRRLHEPVGGGAAVVEALLAALPEEVDLRTNTPATGLVLEEGRVVGVQTADGVVLASKVVIATGGFANRADLIEAHTTWPAGSWGIGSDPYSDGAAMDWAAASNLGIRAAEAIGANSDVIGLPNAEGSAVRLDAPVTPWIWIDAEGARFTDENQRWSLAPAAQAEQNAPVWAVATFAALEAGVSNSEFGAIEEELICGDAAELPRALGIEPAAFEHTLNDLEIARAAGRTDGVGRAASTLPDLVGELCAFPPGRLASKSFGGLDVADDGQVLDATGAPVVGLYAIGEAAGMGQPGLGGAWGFDGSFSAVLWSGWRVGAALAAAE